MLSATKIESTPAPLSPDMLIITSTPIDRGVVPNAKEVLVKLKKWDDVPQRKKVLGRSLVNYSLKPHSSFDVVNADTNPL